MERTWERAWARAWRHARARAIDLVVILYSAATAVWLYVFGFICVWADPFGRARRPLETTARVGRRHVPAEIHLYRGNSEASLRLLAFFWRSYPTHTVLDLEALAIRHRLPRTVMDVGGVIMYSLPAGRVRVGFRAQVELGARRVTVTHTARETDRASLEGFTTCDHPSAPLLLGAAGPDDILKPLLGRPLCARLGLETC